MAYKNRPALVTETGEKVHITLLGGEKIRVREKDVEPLHPGPCAWGDLEPGDSPAPELSGEAAVREAWELLEGNSVSLRELAELVYGTYTAKSAWAAYVLLKDGLYFSGGIDAVKARDAADLAAEEKKRREKRRDLLEREAFLARLRDRSPRLPGDRRFLQDVEALARGQTDQSRTLRDLGRPETPQEAHGLLLDTGVWDVWINPHPARFGLSSGSALLPPGEPPGEERLDLTHLASFAIDNAWSRDPDDAVSLEGHTLWVHVADPAASIRPDSPPDLEARGRGATLYLPEGSCRMLAEEALSRYALGFSGVSPALSFKVVLGDDGSVAEAGIFRSRVRVTRMTYEEADAAIRENSPALTGLLKTAERNLSRRHAAGAVSMAFPETHITVSPGKVSIEPIPASVSAGLVRECMLLAGEAAAWWAIRRANRLPFPYISQETGDLPASPPPGLAGSYQLRRCMRPRTLSVKPGPHWGLGLEEYTQVTSPLRRYTDLLAHQQIRAFLEGGEPLDEDELLLRLTAAEAAAAAATQAERASRAHWTTVYLSGKKGSRWEGVVVDKKGGRGVIIIPALGWETQAALKNDAEPNEPVTLTLASVRIPEGEPVFVIE
ncbi:MAG: RNB domain-containing ribonuclease [Spirochaetaceae bacterium]|nr:RNB domain-containing ribonuclease [Spirochaetaceae bacterium]